jgi:hypothetical protein
MTMSIQRERESQELKTLKKPSGSFYVIFAQTTNAHRVLRSTTLTHPLSPYFLSVAGRRY